MLNTPVMNLVETFKQFVKTIFGIITLLWSTHPIALISLIGIDILQGLFPAITAWVTKLMFDAIVEFLYGGNDSSWPTIVILILLNVILTTLLSLFSSVSQYFQGDLNREVSLEIQNQIYAKLSSFVGVAHFEQPEVHNIIQMGNQGAMFGIQQTLVQISALIKNLIVLISFVGILSTIHPLLSVILVAAACFHLYTQLIISQKEIDLSLVTTPIQRRVSYYTYLLSSVEILKEILYFRTGSYLLNKLVTDQKRVNKYHKVQQQQILKWKMGSNLCSSIAIALTTLIIIGVADEQSLTIGDVSLYLVAIGSIQISLSVAFMSISSLYKSNQFYQYFTKLLNLEEPLAILPYMEDVPELSLGLEFKNVSFRYSELHPWVLEDLNLFIPAHECTALIGLNGAGKSTLIKLLLRLLDPTLGVILWDGIDIRKFDPIKYREKIGTVFQDHVHYELSFKENIGLGDVENINNSSKIHTAASLAGIDSLIDTLPSKYDTEITRMFAEGQLPFDLSEGQWQKLAIARMFMRHNAQFLVLDEPTASLDAQAENDLYRYFVDLVVGKTSILVTHRFSTVSIASTIAVLSGGNVVESGTYEELIYKDGLFAELYRTQYEKYKTM